MTPEEAKALNEKICKWVGRPANFLHPIQGMGLMFRYVVPKLTGYRITKDTGDKEHCATVYTGHNSSNFIIKTAYDKDPTTALALAVEKLIEEG